MGKDWIAIASIWVLVAIGAVLVTLYFSSGDAIRSFGVMGAGSLALVSLVSLFSSHSKGIVSRLIYTAGGSWAILGLAGLYILLNP